MKRIFYISCMALCGLLASCTLEDLTGETGDGAATLTIQTVFPDDFNEILPDYPKDGIAVEIRNTMTGSSYLTVTDADGRVTQLVEYGSYSITAYTIAGQAIILSGTTPLRVLDTSDLSDPVVVNTTMSYRSPLILSEIYHTSSKNASGGNYATSGNDRYYVVYNNSDEIQYADGLGFMPHSASNSSNSGTSTTNWYFQPGNIMRDSIPFMSGGFIIPGNGTDHPIEPGGEIIITFKGLDHPTLAGDTRGPLYVNLDRQNVWVAWQSDYAVNGAGTGDNSHLMSMYKKPLGSAYTISNTSPAICIYRMQNFVGDGLVVPAGKTYYEALAEEYVKDPPVQKVTSAHVILAPPNYTSTVVEHVLIPWEWVLDGVEISQYTDGYKRLPTKVDRGFIYPAPAQYSGQTLLRKVDEAATAAAGGRIVYQDNNNASDDWVVLDAPTLLNR